MKKTITADEKLQAFALFVMAVQHHKEAQRYESAIAKIFGDDEAYNGHVSDALYGDDADATPAALDDILARNGIKVAETDKL